MLRLLAEGSRLASNGETVFGDVVASLEDIEVY